MNAILRKSVFLQYDLKQAGKIQPCTAFLIFLTFPPSILPLLANAAVFTQERKQL
jgi:hypothetical protein